MNPQHRLRIWLLQRMDKLGVTKAQAARAMDRDESAVRRMLVEHSDIRIDFERHLMPLMHVLQLSASDLVYAYAVAHGLAVDVVPQAMPDEFDEEPTMVNVARFHESANHLAGLHAQSRVDGSVSTAQAVEIAEAGTRTARLARTVAARVVRRAK